MTDLQSIKIRQLDTRAIDPEALILPSDVYVKLHLPRPHDFTKVNIRELVRGMDAEARKAALIQAEALATYANAWKEELKRM